MSDDFTDKPTLSDPIPLHEMNPLERFSDRSSDYARYRPSYPAAALDTILNGLADPSQLIAADIGAGTGISSRLLAERELQVWAIEPNVAMRQAAAPNPRVTWTNGTAEQTGLSTASIDLVTCFQAFHWFDPQHSLPELHRILKPTGRLAVVWNQRDRTDPFTARYTNLVKQLSNQHPAEEKMLAEQPLFQSACFSNVRQFTIPYHQPLDLDGLIGRARSVSYLPEDAVTQDHLIAGLTELYQQWQDDQAIVYLTYRTEIFLADPISQG
jgi:SAM-dependent methyltransferase